MTTCMATRTCSKGLKLSVVPLCAGASSRDLLQTDVSRLKTRSITGFSTPESAASISSFGGTNFDGSLYGVLYYVSGDAVTGVVQGVCPTLESLQVQGNVATATFADCTFENEPAALPIACTKLTVTLKATPKEKSTCKNNNNDQSFYDISTGEMVFVKLQTGSTFTPASGKVVGVGCQFTPVYLEGSIYEDAKVWKRRVSARRP